MNKPKLIFLLTLLIGLLNVKCGLTSSKEDNQDKSSKNPNDVQKNIPKKSLDHYIVTFNESNSKFVKIEASITLEDALLSMSTNGTKPKRWPHYINNLVAYSDRGEEIDIKSIDSTAWKVDTKFLGKRISLHYNVIIEHEKESWPGGIDGVAFVRDWGLTLSGRSIFVSNGDTKEDIKVEFKKPESWKISTLWKRINSSNEIYIVHGRLQLEESFLFAGVSEDIEIERDGFYLKFVLGGNLIAKNKEQYSQAANNILNYYIDLMGGLPKSEIGSDKTNVLVIANQSESTDGEVIGKNISLFINPEANMQQQMQGWFMFAHEFFHLWNGQTITFPDDESTTWFMEGITNYYTIKALNNTKLADEASIKMVLSRLFYGRYVNDPGYGKLSLSHAASGIEKDNHWGLVYAGGLFAGICMDMEIRNNTNNSKSLDYLMRNLYTKYGGTNHTISNTDILNQVNSLGNTDFSEFIKLYVEGTSISPLEKYLAYAGVSVKTENNQLQLIDIENKSELQDKIWSGFLGKN